jgi:thiol-disulfide isomerase/thioredoxin
MQRRDLLISAAVLGIACLAPVSARGAAPVAADDEVRRELELSKGEGKRLFLLFYASWCGYCRLFDRFLADPAAAAIINREFRILHMRTLERSAAQKALQLAGADDVFTRFAKTPAAGLPFFVVFNGEGGPMATSLSPRDGRNIGFPIGKGDLDVFEKILARVAPAITTAELGVLRAAAQRQHRA